MTIFWAHFEQNDIWTQNKTIIEMNSDSFLLAFFTRFDEMNEK